MAQYSTTCSLEPFGDHLHFHKHVAIRVWRSREKIGEGWRKSAANIKWSALYRIIGGFRVAFNSPKRGFSDD